MNRATAQLSFLPTDAPAASARGVRGRGAVPVFRWTYEAKQPNVKKRRRLHFKFRPRKRHSAERLATTVQLLCFYFDHIAGVELADEAIVTAWADYLRFDWTANCGSPDIIGLIDGIAWRAHVDRFVAFGVARECDLIAPDDVYDNILTPREMLWAITAKAASLYDPDPAERAFKDKFRTTADGFLRGASAWLSKSDEYRRELQRQQSIAAAQRAEDRLHKCGPRLGRVGYGSGAMPTAVASACPPRETREQAEQRRQRFWQSLSPEQRHAARAAVRQQFEVQCANYGWKPDDPKSDELHDALALQWATFKWPRKDGT